MNELRDTPDSTPEPLPGGQGSPLAGVRPLVAEVDLAFRALHSAMDTALEICAAELRINRTDLRCLEVLDRMGPLTAGTLAEVVKLSAAAVTKVVDRLVQVGYVQRSRDRHDRRRVVVGTTELERQRRRAVFEPLVADGMRLLAGYDDDELHLLLGVLERAAQVNRDHVARLTDGS